MLQRSLTVAVTLGALMLSASACEERPQPAPFLCCVLTCTGGLVEASREAPQRGDAGWFCSRGQPQDFSSPCTPEDVSECENQNNTSMGTGTESSSAATSGASGASR